MFNFMKKNEREAIFKTFQVREIPDNLWSKFKTVCLKDKVTLNNCIIDLITEYTDGNIKYGE